jgi:hypothetical protein
MTEQNPTPAPATVSASADADQSGWLAEGRSVDAGQGWTWISEGFALFMKNPLIWVVNIVLLLIILFVLNLIPFLGQLAIQLLTPVFGAGLMLGCKSLDSGGKLEVTHLFEGFKQRTGELILLGLLCHFSRLKRSGGYLELARGDGVGGFAGDSSAGELQNVLDGV